MEFSIFEKKDLKNKTKQFENQNFQKNYAIYLERIGLSDFLMWDIWRTAYRIAICATLKLRYKPK